MPDPRTICCCAAPDGARAGADEQSAVQGAGHDVRDVPRAWGQPAGPEGAAPQARHHPDLLLPGCVMLLES